MKGEMRVMDGRGDTKIAWDSDKPAEVEEARRTFDNLRAKGYLAFLVRGEGKRGELVTGFHPDCERLILAPPVAGG